jgi:predicted alpha/beta superfamily hydrolase
MRRFLLWFLPAAAFAQQHTASPNVSDFSIEAPQLQATRKIWLYLPEGYKSSDRHYPVIYMHDGQNLFDAATSFAGEWNVDGTLDSLHAKVIVVGIENGGSKRIDELTPYSNVKYGGGQGDKYVDFLVHTLKPYIDSHYRTKPEAKSTAIFGSSLGGLISFYAVLKYPGVFGKAGVFSPSFWFSKDIYGLAEKAPKFKNKIYFLAGDSESTDIDMAADMKKMVRIVDEKRCPCLRLDKAVIVKGGKHNEKMWRENFAKAYLWLF